MRVRYLGGRTIVITGPITGATYRFSEFDREILVDPRDAVMMIRDRSFHIVGIVELPTRITG